MFGASRFAGLLKASTPGAHETWTHILKSGGAGGNGVTASWSMKAAVSFNKFGQSTNPTLEESEVLPVFSDSPNADFEEEERGEDTPRMTAGWYGGASGIGRGGERGLGAGGNAMFLLDKDASIPRKVPDILIQIGGCGVSELFVDANKEKFMQCLKVALGADQKHVKVLMGGGVKKLGFLSEKKRAESALSVQKEEGGGGGGGEGEGGEGEGGEGGEDHGFGGYEREKTIIDDAYINISDDESEQVTVTEYDLRLKQDKEAKENPGLVKGGAKGGAKGGGGRRKRDNYEYLKPKGGMHVDESGGTLGNETPVDDASLWVRDADMSVWPPEDKKEVPADYYKEDKVGERQRAAAEEECLAMLQNAYRIMYGMPLYDNVCSNVSRYERRRRRFGLAKLTPYTSQVLPLLARRCPPGPGGGAGGAEQEGGAAAPEDWGLDGRPAAAPAVRAAAEGAVFEGVAHVLRRSEVRGAEAEGDRGAGPHRH
jgi:hypothetical protein